MSVRVDRTVDHLIAGALQAHQNRGLADRMADDDFIVIRDSDGK